MKLYEVLKMILPDFEDRMTQVEKLKDCRPETVFTITLCYMSEEETWITIPVDHPILTFLYGIEIASFSPNENTLQCWVKETSWFNKSHIDIEELKKAFGYTQGMTQEEK